MFDEEIKLPLFAVKSEIYRGHVLLEEERLQLLSLFDQLVGAFVIGGVDVGEDEGGSGILFLQAGGKRDGFLVQLGEDICVFEKVGEIPQSRQDIGKKGKHRADRQNR